MTETCKAKHPKTGEACTRKHGHVGVHCGPSRDLGPVPKAHPSHDGRGKAFKVWKDEDS